MVFYESHFVHWLVSCFVAKIIAILFSFFQPFETNMIRQFSQGQLSMGSIKKHVFHVTFYFLKKISSIHVQPEIKFLLAIFPCLIYFFTRTMNLESDFKRRAQRKLSSGRIFKSTPVNCLKPLGVVVLLICDNDIGLTTCCCCCFSATTTLC